MEIGSVVKGRDIGKNSQNLYIWLACDNCGLERWVRKSKLSKSTYTGLCQVCSMASISRKHPIDSAHPNWKGGISKSKGYILIKLKRHDFFYPMCNKDGYIYEHRLVIAKHLNRCLLSWEIVHHKNGVKDNNHIENLQLLPSRAYHVSDSRLKRMVNVLEKQIVSLKSENVSLKTILYGGY